MTTKPVVIRFFAPIIESSINALMNVIDQKMKQGTNEFTILISSPGGSVLHGLSAYNYLKGLPVKIVTHNFGSIDSIGVVLFCGGDRRLSVPQARFLLHGVSAGFQEPVSTRNCFVNSTTNSTDGIGAGNEHEIIVINRVPGSLYAANHLF